MKLTDQELTRLAATAVMGWPIVAATDLADYDGPFPAYCDGAALTGCLRGHEWEPLTDWRAAGELVEKMRADGWELDLYCTVGAGSNARFISSQWPKRKARPVSMETSGPRAITVAALLAVAAVSEEQVC